MNVAAGLWPAGAKVLHFRAKATVLFRHHTLLRALLYACARRTHKAAPTQYSTQLRVACHAVARMTHRKVRGQVARRRIPLAHAFWARNHQIHSQSHLHSARRSCTHTAARLSGRQRWGRAATCHTKVDGGAVAAGHVRRVQCSHGHSPEHLRRDCLQPAGSRAAMMGEQQGWQGARQFIASCVGRASERSDGICTFLSCIARSKRGDVATAKPRTR